MPLPPPPEDDELALPPPALEDSSGSDEAIVNESEEILPLEGTEIVTDEFGVEWFEENGNWFFKNPEETWELFQV